MTVRIACSPGEVELRRETVLGFFKGGKSITLRLTVALARGLLHRLSDGDGIEGILISFTIVPALIRKISMRNEGHTWA